MYNNALEYGKKKSSFWKKKQDEARSLHHEPSSLPDLKVIQQKVGFLSI
jgi:hypothetical protein